MERESFITRNCAWSLLKKGDWRDKHARPSIFNVIFPVKMDKARLILCFETIYLRILHIFRESSTREDNYLRIGVGRRAFCVFFVKRCVYRYSTFRSCLIKFQNCLTLKSKSPFQNLPRTLLAKLPLESFQKFPREDVFELVVGRIRQSWLTGIF